MKITLNMGVGEAKQSTPMLEAATEQLATIAGQQPERAPGAQVDRQLQAPRGDAGRRLGDPARRPDVGVPRPPDHDRDPADPRLPRPQPARLRRPRQLLARRPRAADLPRDRLRLDRRGPRPRHRDHDHRGDRRGGFELLLGARHAVRRRRAARARPSPRSTRRRSAATRRRGCGPRPSRPRSSSSRRRTPRPTPSRERPEEGEEGEEGPRARDESARNFERREFRGVKMAKTSQKCASSASRSTRPAAYNRCRTCGRPRAYYRKFGLCRLCLREAAHKGYVPGMSKSSW